MVEGTAGNTGIGLAHICNAKGYSLVIYMPNTQSQEKVDLLRLLGAEVRPVPPVPITDAAHFTFQARDHAAQLGNAVWTNQFDNTVRARAGGCGFPDVCWCFASHLTVCAVIPTPPRSQANRQAHLETTGPEIWEQTGGRVDGARWAGSPHRCSPRCLYASTRSRR